MKQLTLSLLLLASPCLGNTENMPSFAQHSWRTLDHAKNALTNVAFIGNEKILDIGCRVGSITDYLASLVPDGMVVGIDASSTRIDYATKTFQRPNLTFKQHMPQQEFDVVCSFWHPHWVANKRAFLTTIHQALKKQGRGVLCCLVKPSRATQCILETMKRNRWNPYNLECALHILPLEQLLPLVEACGFSVKFLQVKENIDQYPDLTLLKEHALSLPLVTGLPEDQKEAFYEDVIDTFKQTYPADEHGVYHDMCPALTLIIEKN